MLRKVRVDYVDAFGTPLGHLHIELAPEEWKLIDNAGRVAFFLPPGHQNHALQSRLTYSLCEDAS